MLIKRYKFSKTATGIANIITKVRLMKTLTYKEEMIYLVSVKGITEKEAVIVIASHLK